MSYEPETPTIKIHRDFNTGKLIWSCTGLKTTVALTEEYESYCLKCDNKDCINKR